MATRGWDRVGGLPAATANFVGRDRELETISTLLLSSARLITLTGPGGIGKTRLAAEAVRRYHKARSVPVYWARLARLVKGCDRAAVEEEVAKAVLDVDFSGRSVFDALVETFAVADAAGRDRQIVLVLDNCEHVVVGAGELIAELLEAVPGLSVVATSREAIGWIDERLVEVPPLTREQALALFRQRAEQAGHPIAEREQITTVESICRHVHNHPLYIQLAAARMRLQPLASILDELSGRAADGRMRWSPGPRFGVDPVTGRSATSSPGRTSCAPTPNVCCWTACRCSPRAMTPTRKTTSVTESSTSGPTWKPSRLSAPTTPAPMRS